MVSNIDTTEVHDFEQYIRAHDLKPDDFALVGVEEPLPVDRIASIRSKVTVTYKATGVSRAYASGYGTNWVVAFGDEWRTGRFSSELSPTIANT